jgi:hypothetical protein
MCSLFPAPTDRQQRAVSQAVPPKSEPPEPPRWTAEEASRAVPRDQPPLNERRSTRMSRTSKPSRWSLGEGSKSGAVVAGARRPPGLASRPARHLDFEGLEKPCRLSLFVKVSSFSVSFLTDRSGPQQSTRAGCDRRALSARTKPVHRVAPLAATLAQYDPYGSGHLPNSGLVIGARGPRRPGPKACAALLGATFPVDETQHRPTHVGGVNSSHRLSPERAASVSGVWSEPAWL